MHADASDAERGILEPVIFSKVVNYKRDVKRNQITQEDRARTDALLADYNVALLRRKRNQWENS